jgi:hypothetical protein
VTKDFAARVGHRFASDYEARLKLDVYHSLLDLASESEQELSDLEPRDRIDARRATYSSTAPCWSRR